MATATASTTTRRPSARERARQNAEAAALAKSERNLKSVPDAPDAQPTLTDVLAEAIASQKDGTPDATPEPTPEPEPKPTPPAKPSATIDLGAKPVTYWFPVATLADGTVVKCAHQKYGHESEVSAKRCIAAVVAQKGHKVS